MWSFIAFVGLVVLVVGVIGVIRPMAGLYLPTRGRAALAVLAGLVVLTIGAVQDQAVNGQAGASRGALPATETPSAVSSLAALEVAVRVVVWDETTSRRPGERAEVWFRGTGSWFPDLRDGGDVNVLGKRPVDVEHELFIYPDGRDGAEIGVPFRLTGEMCPEGCARDSLLVSIYDDRVEVIGEALVGGTSRTFNR